MGFAPSSPVQVPATSTLNVSLIVTASTTAQVGNDTITIHGSAGTNTQTTTFTLRVVEFRVIMVHSTFSPVVLNITAGSTVYWQNLDGPAAGCGGGGASSGNGAHNLVFTTLPAANSSTINQFGIYSYTFTTPGSYFYYSSIDTDHVMNGTIDVTGTSGAGAMTFTMPAFSYFKGGSAPAVPAAPGTTTPVATVAAVAKPVGAEAATPPTAIRGLGFAALFFPNEQSSMFSGLGLVAVIVVLLAVAALGIASATSATGNRKLTSVGATVVSRPPSDSST